MTVNNINDRQKAMNWWNGLTFIDKWEVIVRYKDKVLGYPDRSPDSLTGREIEILFNNYFN